MYLPVELDINDNFESNIEINLNNSKVSFDGFKMLLKIELKFKDFFNLRNDIISSNICQDFFNESLFKDDVIVYNMFDVGNIVIENLDLTDSLFIDVIEL